MPRQQHHPFQTHGINGKANHDVDKHRLNNEAGEVVDRRNMRITSMDGSLLSNKKIKGEEIKYPNKNTIYNGSGTTLAGDWVCIGVSEIKDYIVEFWSDKSGSWNSLIRVDGIIVCYSEDLPISWEHPLQLDKNENCVGGEVYITDNNSAPMYFNIEDMLKHSGELGGTADEKYFSEFNINEQTLSLKIPLDIPVFIDLTSSGSFDTTFGVAGLYVGYHQYSIRFATSEGDRTAWSPSTPLIPALSKKGEGSDQYPGIKSYGAALGTQTSFGAHIRFRVNNENNYDFIEVRRVSYRNNLLTDTGEAGIIGIIDIENGQRGIINFLDKGGEIEEVLDFEDDTITMSEIETAKSIRYFNNKLYLFNISYADREVELNLGESESGNAIYPCIDKIGSQGHNDVWNATYRKELMNGEEYGWGVKVFDANGERSFVKKLGTDTAGNNGDSFRIPDRREEISTDTSRISYNGTCRAANEDGSVSQTHEKFDLANAVTKDDFSSVKNIVDSAVFNPYGAHTPVSQSDSNVDGHDFRINATVQSDFFTASLYNPKGYSPDYFAQGVSVHKVDDLPDWASGFSVVRTEPANRVVAQGIGFYDLISADGGLGTNTQKNKSTVRFYSPDLDSLFASDPTLAQSILDSPDSYQVEFVSPLGFFSELWNGHEVDLGRDKGIDMMTYARILRDEETGSLINPNESSSWGIDGSDGKRYTAFGNWRSGSARTSGYFAGNQRNIKTVDLDSFVEVPEGRANYFELTVNDFIYQYGQTLANEFYEPDVKNWHEPMYIINIVRKDNAIPSTETTKFVETGHYQKVRSVVGESDGSLTQNYQIVDERWEDFLQDLEDPSSPGNALGTYYSTNDRFVTVELPNGDKRKWIDITWKTTGQRTAILDDITNDGFHLSGDTKVYGVYKVNITDNRFFELEFTTELNNGFYVDSLFVPQDDSLIVVEYDNRIPIRVFGGDTWIGESIACMVDKKYDKSGSPETTADDFGFNVGFPYHIWDINTSVKIAKDPSGGDNFEDSNTIQLSKLGFLPARLRQLCVMFCCQSRTNVNFAYNQVGVGLTDDLLAKSFPNVNYISRPLKWDDSNFTGGDLDTIYVADNGLYSDYKTDYGHEYLQWGYGGFRFQPQSVIDYSKENDFRVDFSKPDTIEIENKFCTRGTWSLARPINVQDAPGIRTFLSTNIFDFTDDTGEIKYAFDDLSTSAGELTVFTDNGIIRAIVDKRLLNELSGNVLSTIGADSTGILQQILVTRDVGMSDEMWRGAAEYGNTIFFPNKESVWSYSAGQVKDIARLGYHSRVWQDAIKDFKEGYADSMTAVYDRLHNEYWLTITDEVNKYTINLETRIFATNTTSNYQFAPSDYDIWEVNNVGSDPEAVVVINADVTSDNFYIMGASGTTDFTVKLPDNTVLGTVSEGQVYLLERLLDSKGDWSMVLVDISTEDKTNTYVFSPFVSQGGGWVGTYDYGFDKLLSFNNKVYGMKDFETYELGKGDQINGSNIQGEIHVTSNDAAIRGKEFIRVRVNSDNKPTSVEFYDDFNAYRAGTPSSSLDTTTNAFHLKNYDGYEGYVPRKDASYDSERKRQIGRYLIYKVIHNTTEDFEVSTIETQYKLIK